MDAKTRYKNERRQAIKDELDSRRRPICVAVPEAKFVENVGGIIRTSNAFLLQEVVLDQKVYSKGATVGADKWENITVQSDVIQYCKDQGYALIAMEQHERSVPLWDFEFPEKVAIVTGHEIHGMSDEMVDMCDYVIEIPQYGLVESLNVSTATSIVLYEYCRQYRGR